MNTLLGQNYVPIIVLMSLLATSGGVGDECLGTGTRGGESGGHVNFMTRSGLPCPATSWRMKGNHLANPNQISQAGICPT